MSGRPSNSVANEPRAAYRTATADSARLMENITPAKAKIVTTLLNAIKAKESVEAVNALGEIAPDRFENVMHLIRP